MADIDKSQGGPQAMLRGLLIVVVVVVLAVGGVFWYRNHVGGSGGETQAGTNGGAPVTVGNAQVAMLDAEAIYALPEFTKAKKDLDDLSTKMEQELLQTIKDKHLTNVEAETLRVKMRDELQTRSAQIVEPLNRRVTASIAALAKERNYKVVLDKRIVVTGVVDITDDVKKKFAEIKTVDMSKEEPSTDNDSNVGYVNQEVIGSLQIFKDVQGELARYSEQVAKDLETKGKDKSPADREKMRQDAIRMLQARQEEMMKPINDRVTATITEVAKEKGLSLVLNNTHIMWGGRNLTDDVMKKLVGPAKS